MSSRDRNADLVRRLYADYLNPGRFDHLGEIVSDDFAGPGGQRGPAAFAAPVAGLRTGFPDLTYTVEDVVADADHVAVRWRWTGTFTAAYRGFAPTGAPVTNRGMAIFRVADGKIVRSTIETDRLGFLIAIGAVADDPRFGGPAPRRP